jgi:hypothetical protein
MRCSAAAEAGSSGQQSTAPGAGGTVAANTAAGAAPAAPTAAAAPAKSRMYPDEPRVGVGVVCFREPHSGTNPEVCWRRGFSSSCHCTWTAAGMQHTSFFAHRHTRTRAHPPARCWSSSAPRNLPRGSGASRAAAWSWESRSPVGGWGFAGDSVHSFFLSPKLSTIAHTAPPKRLPPPPPECAVRELMEEASVKLRFDRSANCEGFSKGLRQPTAFAAVDSIVLEGGRAAAASSSGGSGGTEQQGGAARVQFHYVVVEVSESRFWWKWE